MPVTLEPFTPADITDKHLSCLNDKHRMRYSNQRFLGHTHDSCLDYLRSFDGTPNSYLLARFDSEPVGTLTIYRNPNHGTADIGVMSYGHGFGLPMFKAATELLESEGVRKITAGTLSCNTAMIKILRACNMRQEAIRYSQEIAEGHPQDIEYWAKFNRPEIVPYV